MLDYSAILKPVEDILGDSLHIVLLEDASTMRFWDDLIACVGIDHRKKDNIIPGKPRNRRSTERGEYLFGELAGNDVFRRAWKRNPLDVNAFLLGGWNKYRCRVIEKRSQNFGFTLTREMRYRILSAYRKSNLELFDRLGRDPGDLSYFPED